MIFPTIKEYFKIVSISIILLIGLGYYQIALAGWWIYQGWNELQTSNPTNLPTPLPYQWIVPPISANTIIVWSSSIAVSPSWIQASSIASTLTTNAVRINNNTVLTTPWWATVKMSQGTTLSSIIGAPITTSTNLQFTQEWTKILLGRTDASYIFNKPIQISVPTIKSSVNILAKHVWFARSNTVWLTLNPTATCYSDGSSSIPLPTDTNIATVSWMITFYTCRASEFYVDILPWTGYSINMITQTGFNSWYQDIPYYITSTSNVILSRTQPIGALNNGTLEIGMWSYQNNFDFSIIANPLLSSSSFTLSLPNRRWYYDVLMTPMSGMNQTHQAWWFGYLRSIPTSRLLYSPINYYQIVWTGKVFEQVFWWEKRILFDPIFGSSPTHISSITWLSLHIDANQAVEYILSWSSLQTNISGMLSVGLNTIPLDMRSIVEWTSWANTFSISLILSWSNNTWQEYITIYYNKNTPVASIAQSAYNASLNIMTYRLDLDYMTGKNLDEAKFDNNYYLSIWWSCSGVGNTMYGSSDNFLTGTNWYIHSNASTLRETMRRSWTNNNNNTDFWFLLPPGTYSDCTVTVVSEYGITGNTIAIPSFRINTVLPLLTPSTGFVSNNTIYYKFTGNVIPWSWWAHNSDALEMTGSCKLINQANQRNADIYSYNDNSWSTIIEAYINNVGSWDYSCGVRYRTLQWDQSNRSRLTVNTASMRSNQATNNAYFWFADIILNTTWLNNIWAWTQNYPGNTVIVNIMTGITSLYSMVFNYSSFTTFNISLPANIPRQGNGYYHVKFDGAVNAYSPLWVITSYPVSRVFTNSIMLSVASSTPVNAPITSTGFPLAGLVWPLATNIVVTNAPTVFSAGWAIVTIPSATQISSTNGATMTTWAVLTTSVVGTTISFWLPNTSLKFSKPVRIALPLPSNYNTAQLITISVRHRPDSFFSTVWLTNNPNAICDNTGNPSIGGTIAVVEWNYAVIYTCRASEFQFVIPLLATTINNGWWGWSRLTMDYCPWGDFSNSYYDNSCTSDGRPNTTSSNNTQNIVSYNVMTMPLGLMSQDQMRMRVDIVFNRMKDIYSGIQLSRRTNLLKRLSRSSKLFVSDRDLEKKRTSATATIDLLNKKIYIISYFRAVIEKELKNPTLSPISSNWSWLQSSLSTTAASIRIDTTKNTRSTNEYIPLTIRLIDKDWRIATKATNTILFELMRQNAWSTTVNNSDRDQPTVFWSVYDFMPTDQWSKTFSTLRIKKAWQYNLVVRDLIQNTIIGTRTLTIQ